MRPSSAQMPLRLPSTLHQALKEAAAREGVSLNQYCLYILARYSGAEDILNQKKGEDLLRFLAETHALQKAMRPNAAASNQEPPKETPRSRWRRLHAKKRSRTQ